MSLLILEALTVARGSRPILGGLSLRLDPGEAVALRGPNGIGKTSLLRTVAGLQPPMAGRVHAPRGAALAGHDDGLSGALSVAETLRFWAAVWGTHLGGGSALEAYGLQALADCPASRLSAGERRRLALARLIATGCPLWLMDEPTVSLDPVAQEMLARAIAGHLATGGAVLLSTHPDPGFPVDRCLDLAAFRAAEAQDPWSGAGAPA